MKLNKFWKKEKEEKEVEQIKNQFENKYFKYTDTKSLYGKEIVIVRLRNLERQERTTDWNFVFYFNGDKISFSNRSLFKRELNTKDVYFSFSAKELKAMTEISETEYNNYLEKHNRITNKLKEIIICKQF